MVEIDLTRVEGDEANIVGQRQVVGKDVLARIDMDLVNEVRELLKQDYGENSDKYSSYHYEELMEPASPVTCFRYLLFCNKKVDETFKLMKQALVWRKELNIEDLDKNSKEFVKEFYHWSPFAFTGVDNENNDVLYVIGQNYRKPNGILKPTIIKFIMNCLFTWDLKHQNDFRQLTLVFDVTDTGYNNIDVELMRTLIAIVDYIPARIKRIFVVGIPFLVRPVVRLIISLLPEHLGKLLHCGTFEQLIESNISAENLPREVGGCSDERMRLAPIDSPWMDDSPLFADNGEMKKAVEDSIGYNITQQTRDRLRALQIEYEEKAAKK